MGREQRLFAAHEDVLCLSPFFSTACHGQFSGAENKRLALPDEDPIIFSSVLEYLYKGDYSPRLLQDKRHNSWQLENLGQDQSESTIYDDSMDGQVLKDTVIYCAAEKYGLEELKKIALRKQGLRMFVPCIVSFISLNHVSLASVLQNPNHHHRVRYPVLHDPNISQILLC